MKTYIGTRSDSGLTAVTVAAPPAGTKNLDMRLDLRSHSSTGLNWGYNGPGPAQLALALCADALGDDKRAMAIYTKFKERYVSRWSEGQFTITDETIKAAVTALERER